MLGTSQERDVGIDDREERARTAVRNRSKKEEYAACRPEDGGKPSFIGVLQFKKRYVVLLISVCLLTSGEDPKKTRRGELPSAFLAHPQVLS